MVMSKQNVIVTDFVKLCVSQQAIVFVLHATDLCSSMRSCYTENPVEKQKLQDLGGGILGVCTTVAESELVGKKFWRDFGRVPAR